jgi:hypothetical protein
MASILLLTMGQNLMQTESQSLGLHLSLSITAILGTRFPTPEIPTPESSE